MYNCSYNNNLCFPFLTQYNTVTSSDISIEKCPVGVYQKEQEAITTSADVESYQKLPPKRRRVEELEQCEPHGRYPDM